MYNSNLENALQDANYSENDAFVQESLKNQRAIDAEKAQIEETEAKEEGEKQQLAQDEAKKKEDQGKPMTRGERVEQDEKIKPPEEQDKHLGDVILDTPVVGQVAAVGAGALDTAFDLAGMLPWLKSVDDWWDEHHGRNRTRSPLTKAIRDISAIVVPSLAGGAGLFTKVATGVSKLGKAGQVLAQSRRWNTIGRIGLDMGVGAGIDAVSEQSYERGNASSAISNLFGVQTPWDTQHIDDPDVRFKMNMLEGLAMSTPFALLDGFFSLIGKGTKIIPKDEVAEGLVKNTAVREADAVKAADGDPLTAVVDSKQMAREAAQTDEAIRQYQQMEMDLEVNPGKEPKYNAFINEPAEEQARAVMNYDANPVEFAADVTRIANNTGTVNGRPRPAVTDVFKREIADAPDNTVRSELLAGLAKNVDAQFSVVVGKETLTPKQVEDAVENFVATVQNRPPGEFAETVKSLKNQTDTILGNEVRTLTRDGFNVATKAFAKAFSLLDPKMQKASGVVAGQAGMDIADLSRSIEISGGAIDTTRQQAMIWDNLKVLLPEIRASQFLDGWRLQADNFAKKVARGESDVSTFATWMTETGEGFEVALKGAKEDSLRFINDLETISREKPEYFQPLLQAYAKTNGDVDTIYKLNKLMESKIGFWNKAFVDGSPEVPSLLVKQLQATRYNNILTGLAPVRALAGAGMAMAGKPVTVFVGAAAQGDMGQLKRAMYTFGGIKENFGRAMQVMRQEWRHAIDQPAEIAGRGARADMQIASIAEETIMMDNMANVWYKNGEFGKVGVWNMTKVLSRFNNNPVVRSGINAMYAIDGFVKSMSASAAARGRAYDELFQASKGAIDEKSFNELQRQLYESSFDSRGVLKEGSQAEYMSAEMNLNLDNAMVSSLETAMRNFPVLKSIFMFPRTGANALGVAATFNPLGPLGLSIGRARKALNAKTPQQIEEVLIEHNMAGQGMEAFQALKSEYLGRQAMGSAITMGAAMMAFNGNLTGSGPQDAGERRRMIAMGWKPFSVRDPATGEWRSYQGFEPFDIYLGVVGDLIYQGTRVDQSITEDFFRAVSSSISYNVTSKSFLSGFEPLAGLISGDPSSFQRFFAMQADSIIPLTGIRSILNKAITPQLKDVENNWYSYLANRNKFLPGVGSELVDMVDIYTGKPINYTDPQTAGINALLPFFKTNPGMEEWRQKLLSTGWDRLQVVRTHPTTGEPLEPAERQWINNWIGQNFALGDKVDKLLSMDDGYWMKEIKKYAKARGFRDQDDFPIKETVLYEQLDALHNQAFQLAWAALNQQNTQYSNTDTLQEGVKASLSRGDYQSAQDLSNDLIEYGQN